jgi:hypothetical protein
MMYQDDMKRRWHPDFGRNGSSKEDNVDAFILNPSASQALVRLLFEDPAWESTCEEPDLVIFVRSKSACANRKDAGLWL